MQDPQAIYKLIVLYMMNRVDFSLTKAQISDFILKKEYTNYYTLQQVFAELENAGMVTSQTVHNRTNLTLTQEGRDTLQFFENRVSDTIKADINAFLKENSMTLRDETSATGTYYKMSSGDYEVQLQAREKGIPFVQVSLSVPDEASAAAVCDNWQDKSQVIYRHLIEELF